jgi:hypothetical protein
LQQKIIRSGLLQKKSRRMMNKKWRQKMLNSFPSTAAFIVNLEKNKRRSIKALSGDLLSLNAYSILKQISTNFRINCWTQFLKRPDFSITLFIA